LILFDFSCFLSSTSPSSTGGGGKGCDHPKKNLTNHSDGISFISSHGHADPSLATDVFVLLSTGVQQGDPLDPPLFSSCFQSS